MRVQAYCYESETDIKLYDTEDIEFKHLIVPEKSSYEWRGDGRLQVTLRKRDGPSYWRYIMKDAVREAKELQTWWEMRDRYIEQLEDYIMEENAKDSTKRRSEGKEEEL